MNMAYYGIVSLRSRGQHRVAGRSLTGGRKLGASTESPQGNNLQTRGQITTWDKPVLLC